MREAYLIKNTTKEEREEIVRKSIGNVDALCDGCASGLGEEYYQPYIDGKLEIYELNSQFQTHYISEEGPDETPGRSCVM